MARRSNFELEPLQSALGAGGLPKGMPNESHFCLQENVEVPAIKDGEILVHARYLSVDPYMRGRIAPGANYAAGVVLGGLMQGGVLVK